jgi:hypothetical protein
VRATRIFTFTPLFLHFYIMTLTKMQKNQAAVVLILSVLAVLLLVFALPKLFSRFSSTEEEAPPVKKTYWFTGVTNNENKEDEEDHKEEEDEDHKEEEHKEEEDKEEEEGDDVVVVVDDASKYKIATVSLACTLAIVIVVALMRVRHLKKLVRWGKAANSQFAEAVKIDKKETAVALQLKESGKTLAKEGMYNEALKWKAAHPGGHIYDCMHSIWPENIVFDTRAHEDKDLRAPEKQLDASDPPPPINRYEIGNINNAKFLIAQEQHTAQFENPPANNDPTWLANPLEYEKYGTGENATVFVDQRAVSKMCTSFTRLPKDYVENMQEGEQLHDANLRKGGGDEWFPESWTTLADKNQVAVQPGEVRKKGDLSRYKLYRDYEGADTVKGALLQNWLADLPLKFPQDGNGQGADLPSN